MKGIVMISRFVYSILMIGATVSTVLAQEAVRDQSAERQESPVPPVISEKATQDNVTAVVRQIAEADANIRNLEDKLHALERATMQEANTEHPLSKNFKEKFIKMIDDEDPSVRASAVECLATLRVPFGEIKGRIMKALDDEAPEVRSAGVEAIKALNVPLSEVKGKLLDMLKDKDDDVRVKVLRLLIALRVPASDVEATLNKDYDRKDSLPPLDVIKGMAELGVATDRVKRDLLRDLDNKDWLIQKYAMKGLIILNVPYPEIKDKLLKKLQNRDLQIRLSALRWLIAVASPAEMKAELYAKLSDYYEEVRGEAVEGLVKLGLSPEEMKQKLLEKVGDESESVQKTTLSMLSNLPVSLGDGKEILLAKLDSKSSLVRLEIIKCLLAHCLEDDRIKTALMQLLDEGVEESVPLMLQTDVSADEVKDRFLDKLQSNDKFMQLEAIGALKAFAVPVDGLDGKLKSYVRDANPVIREMAMEIMVRSGMSVEEIEREIVDATDIGYILQAWDKVQAQNVEREIKALNGELRQAHETAAILREEEKGFRGERVSVQQRAVSGPPHTQRSDSPDGTGTGSPGAKSEGAGVFE